METTAPAKRRGRPKAVPLEDRPVPRNLSLMDVERITGLKIVRVEESKNWLTAHLINGVIWHLRKW